MLVSLTCLHVTAEGELKRMLQSLSFGKVKLLQRFKKKDSWAGKEIKSSDSFAVVKVLEHPRKRFRLPIITAEVDVSGVVNALVRT